MAEVENSGTDEQKSESIMRLSWALVHSTQLEDVQRGIAMLEGDFSIHQTSTFMSKIRFYILNSHLSMSKYSEISFYICSTSKSGFLHNLCPFISLITIAYWIFSTSCK